VGYGDTYPRTAEGRIAAMTLMVLGIGLFSAITASVTSFFLSDDGPGDGGDALVQRLRALADLRADGALTEEEFAAAKSRVLQREAADGP
jgi:voltage-gated potassium channel Kch